MSKSRTELASIWPPTAETARAAGHTRQSPLRAIRTKCLDCSCYQVSEVRLCEAVKCPLWPFRAGRHPWLASHEEPPSDSAGFQRGEAFYEGGAVAGSRHDVGEGE